MPGTKGGLWTYRRLLAPRSSAARTPHDLTLFNWPGNDYRDRSIIDRPAAEVAASLQDAKRVSLGFLHWLQTEAPTTAIDAARRRSCCGPTRWARPTACRSIPTSASRGASSR